jgi:hypothetical protein
MNVKGKDKRAYTRLPIMTPEFQDKLNFTLAPRLLNLTLESEMHRELLGMLQVGCAGLFILNLSWFLKRSLFWTQV